MAYPRVIAIVAVVLCAVAFLPGLPLLPVALIAAGMAALFWMAHRKGTAATEPVKAASDSKAPGESDDLYKALKVDPVEITIGSELISLVGEEGKLLADKLGSIRKQYALDMGVVLPPVRVRDEKRMAPTRYEIRIFGSRVADGEVYPDRLLAINPGGTRPPLDGVTAMDPAYGLPAVWIGEPARATARSGGYTVVDAAMVFLTHVSEVLRQNAPNFITRAETEKIIARVREAQPALVDDLFPKTLSFGDLQRVLQNLVRERVPIRNVEAILEVLADYGGRVKDGRGEMQVLTFDSGVEQTISSAIRTIEEKSALVLDPRVAEQVLRKLSEEADRMARTNVRPVLLCPPTLRRHVRRFTERLVPNLSVLSLNEVPGHVSLRGFGVVKV
jgi:flagellar biosynthesis protein FlhA